MAANHNGSGCSSHFESARSRFQRRSSMLNLKPYARGGELSISYPRLRHRKMLSLTGKTEQPEIKDKLVGLALSGGGIRSATFSLGVMQRLAKEGCLEYVDYLSTVSRGRLHWGLFDLAPQRRCRQTQRRRSVRNQ